MKIERKSINTPSAPMALGPYSQAIVTAGLIFTSGQIPLNPKTGNIVEGDFKQRVILVLKNINAVLEAGGTEFSSILKMTVFLTDLSRFSIVNEVFSDQFKGIEPPARSVVEVAGLPMNADIEIECIASV